MESKYSKKATWWTILPLFSYVEYSISSFQHCTQKIKETLDMINNGFKIDFYYAEIILLFIISSLCSALILNQSSSFILETICLLTFFLFFERNFTFWSIIVCRTMKNHLTHRQIISIDYFDDFKHNIKQLPRNS